MQIHHFHLSIYAKLPCRFNRFNKKTLAEQYLIQFSKKSGAFYGPASPYRPTATSRLSYFTHFSFFCHCSYTIPIFSTIKKRLTYLAKIRPSLNENGLAALLKASGFAVFFSPFPPVKFCRSWRHKRPPTKSWPPPNQSQY